jgi:hypothetical protein
MSNPAAKLHQVVPPSVVINVRTSVPVDAVVVRVGAVPPAQSTDAGHVAVLEPVASCTSIKVKLPAFPDAGGFEKVKVQFPVIVILKTLPLLRSTV